MSLAEEQARRQNEVYDALIRELERVPDDARDAVASFLQDLRRDGVDWYRVGDGGEFDDKESFFRTVHAGACMRAARIMGSGCLKFAHEHVAPWDEWTCAFAAWNGHLDCLKYAHENGCPWNENTCIAAAWKGHLDCLKYAHERGCDWDERTCASAAWEGHLDCLKYARENGCDWNERTCDNAADGGHLECLKYAHEQGCDWDEETCASAAWEGHLDCLKYAHENGCDWNETMCASAAWKGHLDCLKYACARECPGSDRYAEALNEVVVPVVDERFGVEVALAFHRNGGEISMREFLPLWVAHREGYRDAHLEVARNVSNSS
jgi:hypothetical protein